MSDPERARICGPLNRSFDWRQPSISPIHSPSEVMLTSTVVSGPIQEISGFRFLCSSSRVLAFGNTRKARGSGQFYPIFSLTDCPEL